VKTPKALKSFERNFQVSLLLLKTLSTFEFSRPSYKILSPMMWAKENKT